MVEQHKVKHWRTLGLRLLLREYAPLIGWIVTWAMITATAGIGNAALLLAATQLINAIRALLMVDVRAVLQHAFRQGHVLDARGWRAVWTFELMALLLSLAAVFGLACLLAGTSHADLAAPLVILAAGLPALYAGPALALVTTRADVGPIRLVRTIFGTAAVLIAVLMGAGILGLAAALAARWWIGLAIVLAALLVHRPPAFSDGSEPPVYEPRWSDLAAKSKASGQQRLTYRLTKILLSGLLGPFGSVLARTLRGTRQLKRVQLGPRAMLTLLVSIALGCTAVVVWLMSRGTHSVNVLLIGVLTRLACIATGTLVWTLISPRVEPESIGLDDDDFD